MKTLLVISSKIKGYWSENRLIFILMLTGTVLSSIVFIYLYGNTMPHKINEAMNTDAKRQFAVRVSDSVGEDDLFFLDNAGYVVQDVMLMAYPDFDYDFSVFRYEIDPMLITFRDNNKGNTVYFDLFDNDKLGDDAIILSKNYLDISAMGINGREYEIVNKIGNLSDGMIFMPIESYMRNGIITLDIVYILESIPSGKEMKHIRALLQDRFPEGFYLNAAESFIQTERGMIVTESFKMGLLYILAVFTFIFLYKYMVDMSAFDYVIYSLAGASKRKTMLLISAELMIISSASSIIAILLHIALQNSLFLKLNVLQNLHYSFLDYLILFLAIMFLSVLCALPFVVVIVRKTLIEAKTHYDV